MEEGSVEAVPAVGSPEETEGPFSLTNRMEAFQRGCFEAIAAAAGAYVSSGPDFDKTDLFVTFLDNQRSWLLQAQLKSSADISEDGDTITFDVDMRTYNKLRDPNSSSAPRVLVVMDLPADPADWAICTHESLSLRRRVFWTHLYELPEVQNKSTRRLKIAKSNLLTSETFVSAVKTATAAFDAARGE